MFCTWTRVVVLPSPSLVLSSSLMSVFSDMSAFYNHLSVLQKLEGHLEQVDFSAKCILPRRTTSLRKTESRLKTTLSIFSKSVGRRCDATSTRFRPTPCLRLSTGDTRDPKSQSFRMLSARLDSYLSPSLPLLPLSPALRYT